jgi:phosphopantetheine binding protein
MLKPGDRQVSRDALEETLLKIWRSVLGTQAIGIHDDFFECGGDSLLAARALARIQKECGKAVSLVTLFDASSVVALAEVLRNEPVPANPPSPLRSRLFWGAVASRSQRIAGGLRAAFRTMRAAGRCV